MIPIPFLSKKKQKTVLDVKETVLDIEDAKGIFKFLGVDLNQFKNENFPHFHEDNWDAEDFHRHIQYLNINFYNYKSNVNQIKMNITGKYVWSVKNAYQEGGICQPGPESIVNINIHAPFFYLHM